MDFDIAAVNINLEIYSSNIGDLAAIRQSLQFELNSKLDGYSFHINFSMTFGHNERGQFESKMTRPKLSSNFLA